jgi:hypothetical protein
VIAPPGLGAGSAAVAEALFAEARRRQRRRRRAPVTPLLDACLTRAGNGGLATARPRRLPVPGMPFARLPPGRARATRRARRGRADAAAATMRSLARADDVTVTDDRGTHYALHPERMWGKHGRAGEPAGPMSVRLSLDPVPGRRVRWLELHSQSGAATRLVRSARPAVRIGQLTPVAASPAERELSDQALGLIELHLASTGVAADILRQRCSAALARIAEIQRSGASLTLPASFRTS